MTATTKDMHGISRDSGAGSAATTTDDRRKPKIDPKAPAGSKDSLGAESVRDGRPSTDDSVVEAMDEEDPGPVK